MALQTTVDQPARSNATYQLGCVKCGKEGCKCASGQGHGAYWHVYWTRAGKTHKRYIGALFVPTIGQGSGAYYSHIWKEHGVGHDHG